LFTGSCMANEKQFSVALSTISGSSFPNILKLFRGRHIDSDFVGRKLSAYAVSLVAEPFRWWEELRYGNAINAMKVPENPVFILGHWRSGTTLLHNMIAQDPQFAFVTTYQGVFPNQLLGSKWLFRNIMQGLMPEKRPSDNMLLSADFPQEEEFALGNTCPYSLYNFWYFPDSAMEFYDKYIRFEGVNNEVKKGWISSYTKLMKKSMLYHGKQQFVSKNPPHTGRIKILLEAFPNAKFIYIYRNPITVFESTKKLISSTIHTLNFQHIDEDWVERTIFEYYKRIIHDYEDAKHLIPRGNLVEVKFEDFEKDTVSGLKNIYESLSIAGLDKALPLFQQYANAQEKYKKNTYKFSSEKVDLIQKHWGFSMKQYNYSLPEGMELV
jgi:hypothetical protein